MSTERRLEMCPYWRKVTKVGNHALVLCGAISTNETSLTDNDGGSRSPFCPWSWGVDEAYHFPSIRRFVKLNGFWQKYHQGGFVNTTLAGKAGIRELEKMWTQAVEKFRREVSNL